MGRWLVTALALIACSVAGNALAQSSDYSDDVESTAPTLILPNMLTSPITSAHDSDGYGATGAPADPGTTDAPAEVPYSVEGEETLDPETN
jgi:hypothetical protein